MAGLKQVRIFTDVLPFELSRPPFFLGDIAQYSNGYYKILGRESADIIKSGGHKIGALEIETELLSHPDILDCAVVGLEDPVWGQRVGNASQFYLLNEKTLYFQVAAVLVPKKKGYLKEEDVKSWCKKHAVIAPYAIPTVWKIVNAMPRNAMGKVNKKELVRNVFLKQSGA